MTERFDDVLRELRLRLQSLTAQKEHLMEMVCIFLCFIGPSLLDGYHLVHLLFLLQTDVAAMDARIEAMKEEHQKQLREERLQKREAYKERDAAHEERDNLQSSLDQMATDLQNAVGTYKRLLGKKDSKHAAERAKFLRTLGTVRHQLDRMVSYMIPSLLLRISYLSYLLDLCLLTSILP